MQKKSRDGHKRRPLELTDNHVEVLRTLAWWEGWTTPYWIGGYNGSHHSQTLRTLVKHGLAEKKVRAGYTRPSYLYKGTLAGRRALRKHQLKGR